MNIKQYQKTHSKQPRLQKKQKISNKQTMLVLRVYFICFHCVLFWLFSKENESTIKRTQHTLPSLLHCSRCLVIFYVLSFCLLWFTLRKAKLQQNYKNAKHTLPSLLHCVCLVCFLCFGTVLFFVLFFVVCSFCFTRKGRKVNKSLISNEL